MRLPRLTTRRLMVIVAVVAAPLAMCSYVEGRRVARQRVAAFHARRVIGLAVGRNPPTGLGLFSLAPNGRPLSPEERRRDEWHFRMYLKYTFAADHPWFPVLPDPPEPK